MSNALYDKLKYVALIALPACATFFAALAKIWGIPYGDLARNFHSKVQQGE